MTHRHIKMGVTVVVLVGAFTGLLWATLRDGAEYYKNVDEVVTDQQAWQGKQLQLHGYVVPGSVLAGAIWTVRPGLDLDLGYQRSFSAQPVDRQWMAGLTYRFSV